MTKEKLIELYAKTAKTKANMSSIELKDEQPMTYVEFLNKLLIDIGAKNNFFFKNIYKSKSTLLKKRKIIIAITDEYVKKNKVFPDSILYPLIDSFTESDFNSIEDKYKSLLLLSPNLLTSRELVYEILEYCIENFEYSIDDLIKIVNSYILSIDLKPGNIIIDYKKLVALSGKYFTKDQQEKFLHSTISLLKEAITLLFNSSFLETMYLKKHYEALIGLFPYLFNFLHYLITFSDSKNSAVDEEKEFLSLLLKPLLYSSTLLSYNALIKVLSEEISLDTFGEMKEQALSVLFEVDGFKKEYIKRKIG
jgi:hypothetical protein